MRARTSDVGGPRQRAVLLCLAVALIAGVVVPLAWTRDHSVGGLHVTATVRVAGLPLALATGYNAVWVTDADHGTVVRIDPKTNRVAATIRVGENPDSVTVGEGAVWVVARPIPSAPNTEIVERIDPASNRVTAKIKVVSGDFLLAPISAAAGAVWVGVSQGGHITGSTYLTRVARIDPVKLRLAALIDVSSLGDLSDLAATGNAVWVAGFNEDSASAAGAILRINPATNRIVKRIPFTFPRCIAANTDGVWVSSATRQSGSISRIDPAANRLSWTAKVGDDPCGLAAGLGSVWAANSYKTADNSDPPVHNTVFQVDARTGSVRASIDVDPGAGGAQRCPLCPGPGGIAVGSGSVWVITEWWNSKTRNTITRIDTTTH